MHDCAGPDCLKVKHKLSKKFQDFSKWRAFERKKIFFSPFFMLMMDVNTKLNKILQKLVSTCDDMFAENFFTSPRLEICKKIDFLKL